MGDFTKGIWRTCEGKGCVNAKSQKRTWEFEIEWEWLVEEFSNRLMKLKNQMRIHEEEIPDRKNIERVLISLPENLMLLLCCCWRN